MKDIHFLPEGSGYPFAWAGSLPILAAGQIRMQSGWHTGPELRGLFEMQALLPCPAQGLAVPFWLKYYNNSSFHKQQTAAAISWQGNAKEIKDVLRNFLNLHWGIWKRFMNMQHVNVQQVFYFGLKLLYCVSQTWQCPWGGGNNILDAHSPDYSHWAISAKSVWRVDEGLWLFHKWHWAHRSWQLSLAHQVQRL